MEFSSLNLCDNPILTESVPTLRLKLNLRTEIMPCIINRARSGIVIKSYLDIIFFLQLNSLRSHFRILGMD